MSWQISPAELRLNTDAVHLWQANLEISEYQFNTLMQLLSVDERERATRYKFDIHRRRFVAARSRLRLILSQYLQIAPERIEFCYGEHGKPFIAEHQNLQQLKFNMSDAHDLALYGITYAREIGVDIEYIHREIENKHIVERFFAANEYQALLAIPKEQQQLAFFYGWTRKEAFIKAIGEGLTHALSDFEVVLNPNIPAALLTIKGSIEAARQWGLHNIPMNADYVAAMVVHGNIGEISKFVF